MFLLKNHIGIMLLGILLFTSNMIAQTSILDSILTIKKNKIHVDELLNLIERRSELNLTYSQGQIKNSAIIKSCNPPCSINDYLNKIADVSDMEIIIQNSNVFLIRNYASNSDKDLSVSGFVKDVETGDVLLGATIVSLKKNTGTTTDENGFFYFKNIDKDDTIKISYVGYSPLLLYDDILDNSVQSMFYVKKSNVLKDVIIDSESNNNAFTYRKFEFYKTLISLGDNTSSLGNNDVLKELTRIPGVEKINDLQGGVSINGFSPQDNIYLLDGVRIFEPNHIFGLFSSFNKKSINKVSVYSNYVPFKYGCALSGIVNSHLIEGNYRNHTIDFSISNSNVGLFLSGPLRKYKTSYFFDMRKSILNFYVPQLIKKSFKFENLDFYDINFKITHRVDMGNKINLFFYRGNDNIRINNSFTKLNATNRYNWGNFAYGLRWEYLFSNSIKSNLILSLSNYNNKSTSIFEIDKTPVEKSYLSIFSVTNIREFAIKHDFKFYSEKSILKVGYKFSKYNLSPTLKGEISEDIIEYNSLIQPDKDSIYSNITGYCSNEYTYEKFKLNTGIKVGYMFNPYNKKVYFNPKIKFEFKLSENSIIDLSFMKSSKLVHSLGSYSVGIPSMIWSISNAELPISNSYNYSMDYIFFKGKFKFSSELYYKKLINILRFKNIADIFNPISSKGVVLPTLTVNGNIKENTLIGNGEAYGINISTDFKYNNLTVNSSFAINRLYNKFEEINYSKEFVGDFDQEYSAYMSVNYMFRKLVFYIDWHIHSGQVFTIPEHIYKDINNHYILDYSLTNNKRMDLYNSLSFGMNYEKDLKKIKYKISFGVSNVLNNFNPMYAYMYRENDYYHVSQVSGLPVLPYLQINIKL